MQLKFISVMVQDQEQALRFYTEVLGFEKMADIALGEYRWLTVTSTNRSPFASLRSRPFVSPDSTFTPATQASYAQSGTDGTTVCAITPWVRPCDWIWPSG